MRPIRVGPGLPGAPSHSCRGPFCGAGRTWRALSLLGALPAVALCMANVMLQLRGGYDLKDASPIQAVARSQIPTLFIHGTEDEMIDPQMTEDLYEAAACPKELLLVEGAGHAQSQDKDPELYYGTIFEFLEKYL